MPFPVLYIQKMNQQGFLYTTDERTRFCKVPLNSHVSSCEVAKIFKKMILKRLLQNKGVNKPMEEITKEQLQMPPSVIYPLC